MAVTQVRSGQKFHCLKADTKPTTNVPTGSQLLETDTGGIWEYNGAAWVPIGPVVERMTLASPVVLYPHHEIHGGSSFTVHYSLTTAATNAHRTGIFIKTGLNTGPLCHMVAEFSCSHAAVYSINEGVTFDVNEGTNGQPIYNRYRDSTKVSTVSDNATAPVANKICTLTEAEIAAGNFAAGTVLRSAPMVAGGGPKAAGGDSREEQEYILKANTKYIFMVTNVGANANTHHILLDWYEHTNR